jgi:hypothetical protein
LIINDFNVHTVGQKTKRGGKSALAILKKHLSGRKGWGLGTPRKAENSNIFKVTS